jgi:hypothetical protein
MNIYALIPLIVFIAYLLLSILSLWSQPSKQRRLFYWYIFASLTWGVSSVMLNVDYLILNKLAFCKLNIITFTWVAIQFYAFSRPYGYGNYPGIVGGAYFILVLIVTLVIVDFIPKSIILGNGVSYSLGIWQTVLSVGLAALAAENIRAQVLAFRGSSEPIQRKRNIIVMIGIGIMLLFTIPMGFIAFSHLPLAHIGNLITASLWLYVLIGLGGHRTQ